MSKKSEGNKILRQLLKENDWVVFGADYCPYCHGVQELLQKNGMEGRYVELQNNQNNIFYQIIVKPEIIKQTKKEWISIPAVFYKGKFIGGFTDAQQKVEKLKNKQTKKKKKNSKIPLALDYSALSKYEEDYGIDEANEDDDYD